MEKKRKITAKETPRAGAAQLPESSRARVLNWLEHAIAAGEIPRGGEIPSERALAKLLGVAKNTAAAAVDEAVARGSVVCREGTRKRYAGDLRSNSLASSTIYVLAQTGRFAEAGTAPGWSDDFLALDVVRQLSLMGRHVSLLSSQTLTDEDFDAVFAGRPGGFITLNSVKSAPLALRALARCRELGIPSVAYGNGPDLQGYDRAYSDHRVGSRDVTRWLLSRGCRRIVPFSPFPPTRFWEHERIEGYKEAMREAGLEPLPCTVFSSPAVLTPQDAEYFHINAALALSKLVALRREGVGPDALLCLNDDWAKPALAAIRDLGLVPNRDILIAGYDNMARNSEYYAFEPGRPAVTVDKHNERSVEDIVSLLIARMKGSLPPEPQARIHAHDAVIFQSEAAVRDLLAPFWGMDRARTIGLSYWGAIEYWGEFPGWPAKGWTHSFFDHDLTPRPSAWLLKSAFLPDEPLVRLAVFGGGPWRTNYVKCWLQELGVKRQYLLDHDVVFE